MGISWKEMKSKRNLNLLERSHDLRIEIDLWVFEDLGFQKKNKEEGELYFGDSIYKSALIY